MNEGLDFRALSPGDWQEAIGVPADESIGELAESLARGERHFWRRRGRDPDKWTFKQRIHADIEEMRAKKRAREKSAKIG